jgi:Uma2 family endonuclease
MSTVRKAHSYTFDEFCFLTGENKADLIDGVIYMASPDNTDANELFVWLVALMHDFAEIKELGKVYGSRVAFRLNDKNSPEPDIAFVKKRRLAKVKRGHVEGPPDLAVEIVSPESVTRDYEKKRVQYERAGVREYWIIDEVEQRVTLLRLGSDKKFRELRLRKAAFLSQVMEGFWIRPEWLWQDPRPKTFTVLQEILAGRES